MNKLQIFNPKKNIKKGSVITYFNKGVYLLPKNSLKAILLYSAHEHMLPKLNKKCSRIVDVYYKNICDLSLYPFINNAETMSFSDILYTLEHVSIASFIFQNKDYFTQIVNDLNKYINSFEYKQANNFVFDNSDFNHCFYCLTLMKSDSGFFRFDNSNIEGICGTITIYDKYQFIHLKIKHTLKVYSFMCSNINNGVFYLDGVELLKSQKSVNLCINHKNTAENINAAEAVQYIKKGKAKAFSINKAFFIDESIKEKKLKKKGFKKKIIKKHNVNFTTYTMDLSDTIKSSTGDTVENVYVKYKW